MDQNGCDHERGDNDRKSWVGCCPLPTLHAHAAKHLHLLELHRMRHLDTIEHSEQQLQGLQRFYAYDAAVHQQQDLVLGLCAMCVPLRHHHLLLFMEELQSDRETEETVL